jgi:hypothetical protein
MWAAVRSLAVIEIMMSSNTKNRAPTKSRCARVALILSNADNYSTFLVPLTGYGY